jgi:hypothetical protein
VTDARGCPVAVEAFAGNTADPATVEAQITKLRTRFGLTDIVLVGDRGLLTSARIERLRETGGIGWVSCLRAPAIRRLVEGGDLQLGLFDERNLAEITSPEFPGERLVVCRNPALAAERSRKREALLAATEEALARVAGMVGRGTLKSAAAIGLRAGRVVDSNKEMAKHFELDIADVVFAYRRRTDAIAAEAALDGLYVVRTSVPAERLGASAVVETYKRLSAVERAFRGMKSVELAVRPIFHWREDRVRAHLFLCFLATTCAGTSRPPGRRSCTATRHRRIESTRSARPSAQPGRSGRSATTGRPTACRWAASRPFWPSSPPSPATGSCQRVPTSGPPSRSSRSRRRSRPRALELIGVSPGSM